MTGKRSGGIGEFIRSQRELANLSLREMAKVARVSNPYLSQIERGLYRPSAEVLKSIADALHISAETLFAHAGLLEADREPATDVETAVRLDPRLTTEEKNTLISVYRNFVGDADRSARSPRRSSTTKRGARKSS